MGVRDIVDLMKDVELVIADLKLADIGDIMVLTIRLLRDLGFDTFIIHAFTGWVDAVDKVAEYARAMNLRLVTVVSMSHKGSFEIIDKNIDSLIDVSLKASAWGCVIGACKKDLIKYVKEKARVKGFDLKVLSPGVGVQGCEPSSAIREGADYEIIGRYITHDQSPREKLFDLIDRYYKVVFK